VLKPFLYKTGNRFVETGYLLVIGLHDVMCHMAAVLIRKEGNWQNEIQLHNYYLDGLHDVTCRVQSLHCNQTLSQLSNLGWMSTGTVAAHAFTMKYTNYTVILMLPHVT